MPDPTSVQHPPVPGVVTSTDLDALLGVSAFLGIGAFGIGLVLAYLVPPIMRAVWVSFWHGGSAP